MKPFAILLTLALTSSASANPATPIADVVAKKGQLIFLTALTVPGIYPDGTLSYSRSLNFSATGKDKLICDAEFSNTSANDYGLSIIPGTDAVFLPGNVAPWLSGFPYDGTRLEVRTEEDGKISQNLLIQFSTLGESRISSLQCQITTPAGVVLTVGDFEAATGGAMTLQAL